MTIRIVNERGDAFTVKFVAPGDRYGLNGCLTATAPMVEFYDAEYAGRKGFDPEGQFVSRYYAVTLLESTSTTGLALDCGVEKWQVSADNMRTVLAWLRAIL